MIIKTSNQYLIIVNNSWIYFNTRKEAQWFLTALIDKTTKMLGEVS